MDAAETRVMNSKQKTDGRLKSRCDKQLHFTRPAGFTYKQSEASGEEYSRVLPTLCEHRTEILTDMQSSGR